MSIVIFLRVVILLMGTVFFQYIYFNLCQTSWSVLYLGFIRTKIIPHRFRVGHTLREDYYPEPQILVK